MTLGWLAGDASAPVFTPEALDDDHRLVGQTAAEFVRQEVAPALEKLEGKNWNEARRLVARAGDLGLLGADVPESEGGAGLDRAAAVLVAEAIGRESSFAMAFGAQTGLAILPVLWFGTADLRARYLPRLLSGEWIGAYGLSEAGAGSDALAARTRAVQQPDGSWRLSGEKLWITNGGFADVFIVFAKADGDRFTAFLVERAFGGLTHGSEEHKMGLHGSSTTPIVLADVPVPAANVIGEVGHGHRVAFNVLNYGRFKLAATCSGAAKAAIGEAAAYARARRQFGRPIEEFGAVQDKLAGMAAAEYGLESALYRVAGDLDAHDRVAPGGASHAATLEAFAVEASLLKILGSESLDAIVDELVQIHGGNGFVRDYAAERRYRDARPNRIFEGTNEINRVLAPGLIAKRIRTGRVSRPSAPLPADAGNVAARGPVPVDPPGLVDAIRRVTVSVLLAALDAKDDPLDRDQVVASLVCDMLVDVLMTTSAAARAAQAAGAALPLAATHADLAAVLAVDAADRVRTRARSAMAVLAAGPALATAAGEIDRALGGVPMNVVAARARIATAVIARQGYPVDVGRIVL